MPDPTSHRPLSLASLRHLAAVAHEDLAGARLQRVHTSAHDERLLLLRLRARQGTVDLAVDLRPFTPRVHLVASPPRAPASPPAFVMLLRKHLDGAHLLRFACAPDDRTLTLDFAHIERAASLRVALGSRPPVAALVDDAGTVVATWPPRAALPDAPAPRPVRDAPAEPALLELTSFDVLSQWLAERWDPVARSAELETRRAAARSRVRATLRRLVRRRSALERDLQAVDDAPRLRHEADLLNAHRGRVPRGAEHVEVPDWLDGGALRAITLDPARSLEDQVETRYRRARRLERGGELVLERLEQTEASLRALAEADTALAAATDPATLDAIVAPLRLVSPQVRTSSSSRGNAPPRLAWHAFVSSDGLPLFVGRSARDNDRLTFQHARGNDLWLHVEDHSGSHVIVRAPRGRPVPRRTLEEAALLAAHFSDARGEAVVAVRWTERKNVRKPRGAPPGSVSVAAARSLDIREDPERLDALLRQGREDIGAVPASTTPDAATQGLGVSTRDAPSGASKTKSPGS